MVQAGDGAELIDSLQVPFGRLDIYPQYMVTTTNEHYRVSTDDFTLAANVAQEYFGAAKQWGLIANRENNYTLDVAHLNKGFAGSSLIALALVIGEEASAAGGGAWLPEQIYSNSFPVRAFVTLEKAREWVRQQIGGGQ